MNENQYKQKYKELKLKYMNSVETAFRLGFEQGKQQAQMDSMAQEQQQAMDSMNAQNMQPQDGQNPEAPQEEGQEQPMSAHPEGSELDQHIAELEGLLGKSELKADDLQKALGKLKEDRKKSIQETELKKSAQAIKGIAKNLHKPQFKMSKEASHNVTDNSKKALSMQQQIVSDVMKAWTEEESKASNDISNILNIEGVTDKK